MRANLPGWIMIILAGCIYGASVQVLSDDSAIASAAVGLVLMDAGYRLYMNLGETKWEQWMSPYTGGFLLFAPAWLLPFAVAAVIGMLFLFGLLNP